MLMMDIDVPSSELREVLGYFLELLKEESDIVYKCTAM